MSLVCRYLGEKKGLLSHKDVQVKGAECAHGDQEMKMSCFSAHPGARQNKKLKNFLFRAALDLLLSPGPKRLSF